MLVPTAHPRSVMQCGCVHRYALIMHTYAYVWPRSGWVWAWMQQSTENVLDRCCARAHHGSMTKTEWTHEHEWHEVVPGKQACRCGWHRYPGSEGGRMTMTEWTQGFQDGRAWQQATAVGDTIALPTDPSAEWADGFAHGRSTTTEEA